MKMFSKKKIFIVLLVIGVLVLLGRFFLFPSKTALKTAMAERRDLEITVEVSGKVKADRSANLSFATLGQLEKIASSGATFKKGEILARLKTNELYASLQEAYASLNKARSTLSYYLEVQGETEKTYLGSDDISRAKRNEARTNAEAYYASVQYYQFALDQAQAAYQKAFLTAPFAGVVGQTLMKVGETAAVTSPVLTFVDPSSYYFEVEVDEIDVSALRSGLPVQLHLDAYGDRTFKGEVASVDLASHTTSSGGTGYYVRIVFTEPDGVELSSLLRPGLNGDATILKEVKKDALVVPAEAYLSEGEHSYVEVVVGGKKQKKEVTFGELTEGSYEVLSGLSEGETVVVH